MWGDGVQNKLTISKVLDEWGKQNCFPAKKEAYLDKVLK